MSLLFFKNKWLKDYNVDNYLNDNDNDNTYMIMLIINKFILLIVIIKIIIINFIIMQFIKVKNLTIFIFIKTKKYIYI